MALSARQPRLQLAMLLLAAFSFPLLALAQNTTHVPLLILGGGITALSAALLLSSTYNYSSYLIIEGSPQLGGRMRSTSFGSPSSPGGRHLIELGANWVQGLTNADTGVENPIWMLAQQVNLTTTYSDYSNFTAYSSNGTLFLCLVNNLMSSFSDSFSTYLALAGERQERGLHDMTARTGLRLGDWQEGGFVEQAVEYWEFDMEYSQLGMATVRSSPVRSWTGLEFWQ